MTVLATEDFAGTGALSGNWSSVTSESAFTRNADKGEAPAVSVAGNRYTGVAWGTDQYAKCTLVTAIDAATDAGAGPAVRIASAAQTQYFLQGNAVETRLYKVVAGTFTQLGTDAVACANGDILELRAEGTTITAIRNGSNICSSPLTDSSISSGDAGIWAGVSNTAINIDDWEGGNFLATPGSKGTIFNRTIRPRAFAPGFSR